MREPDQCGDDLDDAEQPCQEGRTTESLDETGPAPDFPHVPNRDVGTDGTRDVDAPPNTAAG